MTNKTYDRVKWVSLVLLPALASAYFALGQLWHFPHVEEVVGTITILDTFLGILLGKTSKDYGKIADHPELVGDLVVYQDVDGTPVTARMEPHTAVPIFEEGKLAAFRVRREPLS